MIDTVADVIAKVLKRNGVDSVFGQSLPSAFFLAAERHGIRQVSYRTENAGGAMADAFARRSGKIGVIGAQNGPAATLLVPPMAEAMTASVPMLALVQEVPTTAADRNAFQEIDHYKLFEGVTKWIKTLRDPERAEEYVEAALRAALSGRPGPVVLLLPKNLLIMEAPTVSDRPREGASASFPLDRVRPDAVSVRRAAEIISSAECPVVIAGGGVHLSGAVEELVELQHLAALPVATTNMGKGAVSELDDLSIGVTGNAMSTESPQRLARELLGKADVILLVGSRTNENGTDAWTLYPESAKVIHIDSDGNEVGRNYASVRIVGDAKLAVRDLIDVLAGMDLSHRKSRRDALVAEIARVRRDREAVIKSYAEPEEDIKPQSVAALLDELTDGETTFAADASYSSLWTTNYLRAKRAGQRFLTPRGLAGLGWGLPFALGAQVADPGGRVVCLTGDGGFGHVWSELETMMRESLPVTVVVLNNQILGFQRHAEFVQFEACTSACEFSPVDHAAIARAVGMDAVRVERGSELRAALASALASVRPTLVEVVVSPNEHPPITLWEARAEVLAANRLS
ncbi:acetolactate synthase catalytic subunit [Pseudarthrobacter sp. CCNWLW207]|uniref:acetolactate synthase catalytic subunit n=1 Tax=Pseudarthrobacter sp. CCNWLW207 TaxID=3127468 RepID=UPI00307716FE